MKKISKIVGLVAVCGVLIMFFSCSRKCECTFKDGSKEKITRKSGRECSQLSTSTTTCVDE
jgi:hypothetical protein